MNKNCKCLVAGGHLAQLEGQGGCSHHHWWEGNRFPGSEWPTGACHVGRPSTGERTSTVCPEWADCPRGGGRPAQPSHHQCSEVFGWKRGMNSFLRFRWSCGSLWSLWRQCRKRADPSPRKMDKMLTWSLTASIPILGPFHPLWSLGKIPVPSTQGIIAS